MTDQNKLKGLRDRIWITSKTKMEAEKRYQTYDSFTHILLCLFSIALIGITVFTDKLPSSVPTNSYNILLSVTIIVFSVVVFGFGFGKTAILHRECYLRLQKLCDSKSSAEDIESSYHEIISAYPNHNDTDYDRLILNRTLFRSDKITNPNGESIVWSWPMLIKFVVLELIFWLTPMIVFAFLIWSLFWKW